MLTIENWLSVVRKNQHTIAIGLLATAFRFCRYSDDAAVNPRAN
jgi:hypothetical protein